MVTLGQKLKLVKTPKKKLYNWIRIVPCKKLLEETLNILEMRTF